MRAGSRFEKHIYFQCKLTPDPLKCYWLISSCILCRNAAGTGAGAAGAACAAGAAAAAAAAVSAAAAAAAVIVFDVNAAVDDDAAANFPGGGFSLTELFEIVSHETTCQKMLSLGLQVDNFQRGMSLWKHLGPSWSRAKLSLTTLSGSHTLSTMMPPQSRAGGCF